MHWLTYLLYKSNSDNLKLILIKELFDDKYQSDYIIKKVDIVDAVYKIIHGSSHNIYESIQIYDGDNKIWEYQQFRHFISVK